MCHSASRVCLPLTPRRRDVVCQEVSDAIADANRGVFPCTEQHWLRVAARFGLRVHTGPEVTEPHILYNHFHSRGVLYLPLTDSYARLHLFYVHEISELLVSLECRAQFNYPGEWGGDHDIALMIDGRG